VIVVDPVQRTVRMCERDRDETAGLGAIAHSVGYPTLHLDVDALFTRII
jgi:hypothetical protein